jgi:DNA-binding NtrC family response regulator
MDASKTGDSSHFAVKILTPDRVLVIDDDDLMRWAVAETLREDGWQVIEAGDRREAEAALGTADAPFDVVLLDYRLPDSDNLSLLATIRARSPHSRVILMTAFQTEDMVRDALALGASTVIGKPFDMETVPALVTHVWH